MSAYTDAVNADAPSFYYPLNETSGSSFANISPSTAGLIPLTKIGSPLMGQPSLLPGDPTNGSLLNAANTQMAERVDNGIIDRPGTSTLSLTIWCRPDTLKATSDQVLFSKASVYQLILTATQIRFDVGATQYLSVRDVVTPGSTMYITATYDNPTGHRIYVNGQKVSANEPAVSTNPPYTNGGKLELGGFSTFGTTGFTGAIQHAAVWQNTARTLTQHRNLYMLGIASAAEIAGKAMNVFSFSRQIVNANSIRKYLRLTNDSNSKVYLNLGATAVVGGGIVLYPGEYWETPRHGSTLTYTGAVSGIHSMPAGAKQIAIHEES